MFFEANEDEKKFIEIAALHGLSQTTAEQLVTLIGKIHSDDFNNNHQLYEDLTKLIEHEVKERGID